MEHYQYSSINHKHTNFCIAIQSILLKTDGSLLENNSASFRKHTATRLADIQTITRDLCGSGWMKCSICFKMCFLLSVRSAHNPLHRIFGPRIHWLFLIHVLQCLLTNKLWIGALIWKISKLFYVNNYCMH